jgi:hypothetical protein
MIIQEADELLYSYSAAGESACYIIERDDGRVFDLKNKYTKTQIKGICKTQGIEEYRLWKYYTSQPISFAIHALKCKIAELEQLDKDVLYCISGKDNFRIKSALRKPYKGNRYTCGATLGHAGCNYTCGVAVKEKRVDDREGGYHYICPVHGITTPTKRKPIHYSDLRTYLEDNHNVLVCNGFEADDGLGLFHGDNNKIMSHIDKDIKMIPGTHLDWRTMETYEMTPRDASYCFFVQMLTGDKTDNIPGCPYSPKTAYGASRATLALGNSKATPDLLKAVTEAYREAFSEDWKKYMLEGADLLWICRNPTDSLENSEKGSIIMEKLLEKYE